MERVKDVLHRYSPDLKKLKVLKERRKELDRVLNARKRDILDLDADKIDDKIRELDRQIKFVCDKTRRRIFDDIYNQEDETSMASSSSSGSPEDEASPSNINGGEQKQTVLGQGGIGLTIIINSRSNITNEFGYVHIENK